MTTADWALIISLGSLTIALLSFIWNIWSKFIYPKPKIKTYIQSMSLVHKSGKQGEKCICLSATNHGPTEVTLYNAIAKGKSRWFSKTKERGLLNPIENFPSSMTDSNGPFSGGLPKKLAVGEQFSVYFPRKIKWFEEGMIDIGFSDTFGREHWCGKEQIDQLKKTS